MKNENFYFLTDDYCERYKDYGVMSNKEADGENEHNRPCFYALQDNDNLNIYWMIPISSKIEKYQDLLAYKLKKYPTYDGLEFGYVRGRESAFLLQNICPVKRTDIDKKYIDKNTGKPVTISSNRLKRNILQKARKLIGLSKRGFRVTQTDIAYIYNDLIAK